MRSRANKSPMYPTTGKYMFKVNWEQDVFKVNWEQDVFRVNNKNI